jgi:hypothetical protein
MAPEEEYQSKYWERAQNPAISTMAGRGSNQKGTMEEVKRIRRRETRDADFFVQQEE